MIGGRSSLPLGLLTDLDLGRDFDMLRGWGWGV